MSLLGTLKEELRGLQTLNFISSSLTEINAIKIKTIREGFERNRRFFAEIASLYHSIKLIDAKRGLIKSRTKNEKNLDTAKTLSIAITSNLHFYGTLNSEVIKKFSQETSGQKTDLLIIGSTGVEYFSALEKNRTFEKTRFARDFPTSQEISQLIEKTRKYQQIMVYYPAFITILSQKAACLDITQTAIPTEAAEEKIEYILEPELKEMLEFFERQIRTLLFARCLMEAEISRTAARLISMSSSEEKTRKSINDKTSLLNKAFKSLKNSRLLETFSGIKKWQT